MKRSYYNAAAHIGSQPVRVLYQNIQFWFKNTYPKFATTELNDAIANKGLNQELNYVEGKERINGTPAYVVFGSLSIRETFLSYLWCLSYSLIVILDEQIIRPRITPDYELTPEMSRKLSEAHALKRYGLSLFTTFTEWNMDLPNPENYDWEENHHIEKTNAVFLHAVSFILLHELGHIILEADEEVAATKDIKTKEYEADAYALRTIIKGSLTNDTTLQAGIFSGLCSLIFFSSKMKGGTHPNPDERLKIALEDLEIEEGHNFWALACLAINFWGSFHERTLNWPPDNEKETYKEVFYHLLENLEEIRNT